MKKRVVIGFLGTTLDNGRGAGRWEKWRPSVNLCQHEDLLIARFELLYSEEHSALAKTITADIKNISPETQVRQQPVVLKNPWDFEEMYAALHDFARVYQFDTEHEEYFMHITTGTHVAQICMYLLTEAHYFPAKLLQGAPPRRQTRGEPGSYSIIDLDLSRYDRINTRFHREQQEALSYLKSGIATRNPTFNALIDRIEQVAIRSRASLLLTGPTGAGKSHLARRIYELKKARHQIDGAFVEVNCATLRGDGAMSTLFGHVKGAFTGAVSERPGLLRAANSGQLFLDEIGELGLDEQAMLLRAIEEKRFMPVGSDKEVSSDFQMIAGTNRDLAKDVVAGRFREDLYARLNLWIFHLPGLKERREDIEPNLDYELERYSHLHGQHVTLNTEARRRFLDFATSTQALWSANFRDLTATITRMATLAPGGRIKLPEVESEIEYLKQKWCVQESDGSQEVLQHVLGRDNTEALDLFHRVQLAEVIKLCRRSKNLSEAGRLLFSASREQKKNANDADRLRKYLASFGLDWKMVRSD